MIKFFYLGLVMMLAGLFVGLNCPNGEAYSGDILAGSLFVFSVGSVLTIIAALKIKLRNEKNNQKYPSRNYEGYLILSLISEIIMVRWEG